MEEDWVVLCQALHQLSGEERTKMGVKKALCALRCPIMESFRRMGFQEAEVFIPPHDLCPKAQTCLGRPRNGSTTSSSTRGMPNVTALTRCRTAAYLLTMWHHGFPGSPQWEGELELDSASDSDSTNGAMVQDMRDYISVIRECSLWILIRDSLCPPDVIRLHTAERRWNNPQSYGEIAALSGSSS